MGTRTKSLAKQEGGGEEPANDGGQLEMTSEQRQLFEEGLPMVRQCAAEVGTRWRYPSQDLLGAGTVALHEVTRTYDPEQHPSFPVFARHHIRGRMIDAVKAEPWSSGSRVERAMERAFEVVMSHHVVDADLFRDSEEEILDRAREGEAEVLAAAFLAGLREKQEEDAEETVVERLWLRDGVARLYPPEREVVRLVYWQGKTADEVARELGVNPKTVRRRHAAALRKLREMHDGLRKKDRGSG